MRHQPRPPARLRLIDKPTQIGIESGRASQPIQIAQDAFAPAQPQQINPTRLKLFRNQPAMEEAKPRRSKRAGLAAPLPHRRMQPLQIVKPEQSLRRSRRPSQRQRPARFEITD